jgi:hypothetical protein
MKLAFKKILANVLVLMVVMLPLRAMAMPVDTSSDHCMDSEMTGEMSAMSHEGHQMPANDGNDQQASNCQCCEQCVSDCTDCASLTVVTLELLQFSDVKNHDVYTVTTELLFTHITSPPSKPPQGLTI